MVIGPPSPPSLFSQVDDYSVVNTILCFACFGGFASMCSDETLLFGLYRMKSLFNQRIIEKVKAFFLIIFFFWKQPPTLIFLRDGPDRALDPIKQLPRF